MSGGHYSYFYSRIDMFLEQLYEDLDNPDVEEAIKSHIAVCIHQAEGLKTLSKRLEWYLSGDDSLESFYKRLQEGLEDKMNKPSTEEVESNLRACERRMKHYQFIADLAQDRMKEAHQDEKQAMSYLQQTRDALGWSGDFPTMIEAIKNGVLK